MESFYFVLNKAMEAFQTEMNVLYLGHAWQEQKSREGGDFLRAANTTPEGWRFAERRKYYPTFTSATDKP